MSARGIFSGKVSSVVFTFNKQLFKGIISVECGSMAVQGADVVSLSFKSLRDGLSEFLKKKVLFQKATRNYIFLKC